MALAFRNSLKIGKLEKITPHYEVMTHEGFKIPSQGSNMQDFDNHEPY